MSGCEIFATKAEVAELKRLLTEMQHEFLRKSDEPRIVETTKNDLINSSMFLAAIAAKVLEEVLKRLPNFSQFLTKGEHQNTVDRLNKVFNKVDDVDLKADEARNEAKANRRAAERAEQIANEANSNSKKATQVANGASGVANESKTLAQRLNTDVSQLGNEFKNANGKISALGTAINTLGAIVNSIFAILSVVGGAAGLLSLFGTLYAIIPRLNAQEAYIDSTNKLAADAYSQAMSNKIKIRDEVNRLNAELAKANSEIARLSAALNVANSRIAELEQFEHEIKTYVIPLFQARDEFLTETLANLGLEIHEYVTQTEANFADVRYQTNQVRSDANRAIREANNARTIANIATENANEALRRAGKADDTSRQAQQDINSGDVTKRWKPKVWQPAATIAHQTATELVKPVEVQMGNFERSQKEIKANIEKQFGKLPSFEEQLAKNQAEIKKQQGTLPTFNDLDSINRSLDKNLDQSYKELEKLKAQTQQIEQKQVEQTKTPTMLTWVDQRFKEIEKVNAEANKKLDDIQKNFEKLPGIISGTINATLPPVVIKTAGDTAKVIEKSLGETTKIFTDGATQFGKSTQEVVKKFGDYNEKLAGIPGLVLGGLAVTVPFALINNQPFRELLVEKAAEATCKTTQPGGCMTKLGNDIATNTANKNNQNLQQGLRDFRDGLDLAAGADTNLRVRNIERAVGANEYPMIVPEYLLDDFMDKQAIITSQPQYNAWLLKQIDALVGLFPIKIERTDENGQKQTLTFENIAEAIAELTGLLSQIAFDADTAVNVGTRATGEALGAKAAALQVGSYVKAIIDHMGFQTQHMSIDVPVSVTLGAVGSDGKLQESELKDFLKPSTQKAVGLKNTDPVDMRLILRRILEDGEIARAALFRPLKPNPADNTLTGDAIKQEKKAEKKRVDDAWEAFKLRYEGHTSGTKIDIDDSTTSSPNTTP